MSKFKIGDRVKVIKDGYRQEGIRNNQFGLIVSLIGTGLVYVKAETPNVGDEEQRPWAFREDELELAKKEQK